MTERLVVGVRWQGVGLHAPDEERAAHAAWVAETAPKLVDRAAALGGRVVGWHATGAIFDFALDGLQDAIDFVLEAEASPELAWGVTHGDLTTFGETSRVVLATGPTLADATALAECARPGEVLVSPRLVEASGGRILTRGEARPRRGQEGVEPLILDLIYPLRGLLDEAVGRIVDPEWMGPRLAALEPGEVAVVRVERGGGGTRALVEAAASEPSLIVRPAAAGVPLGALGAALRGLPEGRAAAESALRERGARLVLIDDATLVDADSLEVLRAQCDAGALAVVLRLGEYDPVPPAFEDAELAREVRWFEELSRLDQRVFATAAAAGGLPVELAERFASGATLLGVVERLADAVESGDLIWSESGLEARLADFECAADLGTTLERRLVRLSRAARDVLEVLAVAGGELGGAEIGAIFRAVPSQGGDAEPRLPDARTIEDILWQLSLGRWLSVGGAQFRSETQRQFVLASLEAGKGQQLHAAIADVRRTADDLLMQVSSVAHAFMLGDPARARRRAGAVAVSLAELGLDETADALGGFARGGPSSLLVDRGLLPASEASEEGLELEAVEEIERVSLNLVPRGTARAPAEEPALGPLHLLQVQRFAEGAVAASAESESIFPADVAAALSQGDAGALREMSLAKRDRQPAAAARLAAMASLAAGQPGEALRELRSAKEALSGADASTRCRMCLALAVALAAASRPYESFLEALQGLARAREGQDERGERACARFLAQLAERLDDQASASAWRALCGSS